MNITRQTHAVRHELHNISVELAIIKEHYHKFPQEIMWNMDDKMKKKNRELITMLSYAARQEIKLEIILEKTIREQRLLKTLKRHEIDENILSQEQLNKIIVDIKLTGGQLEIPIPAEHLRVEEISQIARIDACIWNEDIMVIIDIPLVSRETYRFYKMHPLPSQQYTQGKPLGLAAIRPRNTFVAINEQGTTHFQFNQEDLGVNCIHRHYAWVCKAFVPLRSVVNEMDCEVTLLTKHELV